MALDKSLARAFSHRNLADWTSSGASLETSIQQRVRQAQVDFQTGRPPIKVAKKLVDQLSQLIKQSGLPGEVKDCGGRRHEATICMPQAVNDTASFVLASVSINGRNGTINLTHRYALTASLHALERLHQRLGMTDPLAVLQEVYNCLAAAATMDEAARIVRAWHWPVVTANGLFVCAPGKCGENTVLVTWMRNDQLGKKWGRVADNLRAASRESIQLLEDRDFCIELLRLHAWLLRPHSPGPNLSAIWWDSQSLTEQEESVREFENSLSQQEADSVVSTDESHLASTGDELEGTDNPCFTDAVGQPHVVKAREQYNGIVVQLRSDGDRVVALRNGFFGVLRQGCGTVEGRTGEATPALRLGARVTVEVFRVLGGAYKDPSSIVLLLPEVADAEWALVQQHHAVGSVVSGVVVWQGDSGAVLEMPDGASGWLSGSELTWLQGNLLFRESIVLGQQIESQVIGYMPEYRRLRLSLRRADEDATDVSAVECQSPVGAVVEGAVVWLGPGGAVIKFSDELSGWLPSAELGWSRSDRKLRDPLVIGQGLRVRVIGYDQKRSRFVLSLREVDGHPLDRIDESALLGATQTGVVSNVMDYGVFVRLPIQFDGLLHQSEIPEGMSFFEGDVLDVRVISIDRERRRISLAYVGACALR